MMVGASTHYTPSGPSLQADALRQSPLKTGKQPQVSPLRAVIMNGDAQRPLLLSGQDERLA